MGLGRRAAVPRLIDLLRSASLTTGTDGPLSGIARMAADAICGIEGTRGLEQNNLGSDRSSEVPASPW